MKIRKEGIHTNDLMALVGPFLQDQALDRNTVKDNMEEVVNRFADYIQSEADPKSTLRKRQKAVAESESLLSKYLNGEIPTLNRNGLPTREQLMMTDRYKPKNTTYAIKMLGTVLINFGEILTLVGLPGRGKTSVLELIITAYLTAKVYAGFEFGRTDKKVLLIDTERPTDDVYRTYMNIKRRTKGKLSGLVNLSVSELSNVDDLKAIVEREMDTGEFELLCIDGILDFTTSMNDDKNSNDVVRWFRSIAVKHNAAVIVTIHPNKGSETIAGHIGSFLYRFCRAIIYARSVKGEKSVYEISIQPSMSKLSHGNMSNFIPVYYEWDEVEAMMMPIEWQPPVKSNTDNLSKIADVLTGEMTHTDLYKTLVDTYGISEPTAKRWISKEVKIGTIIKTARYYKLIEPE